MLSVSPKTLSHGPSSAAKVPPGHLQRADAGTEYLQFSPAKEMAEVEQQIMKNMQAMQAR